MSHFKFVRNLVHHQEPYEVEIFLCSKTCAAAIDDSRPARRNFRASEHQNVAWFDKFVKHTGENPSELLFQKGAKNTSRWYVACVN